MSRIGVVLATYNGEKYLAEMLDSLLTQTRKADFLFVVDDGSKDSTLKILSSYSEKLPIQLHVHKKNCGHRTAFSKALEMAKETLNAEDFIVLADQDDIWLPEKIKILENAISSCKVNGKFVDLVFGDAEVIDSKGNLIETSWRLQGNLIKELSLKNLMTGYTNMTGCLSIFRVSLLKKILPIPLAVPVHDQWIAWCAALNNGYKAIDEKVIQYRLHENNAIGIGKKHIWSKEIQKNLEWSRLLFSLRETSELSVSEQKFLKEYIKYLEKRLGRNFLPEYFFWALKNGKNLYPHVKGKMALLKRACISILGVSFLKKFANKKAEI